MSSKEKDEPPHRKATATPKTPQGLQSNLDGRSRVKSQLLGSR